MKWAIEDYAGATVAGTCTDGWDAANVQISEDDGNTWKVLSGSPEYNCDNCFGFRFNTGDCNIPGWTDIINDWTDAKFSLSEFNGKSIKKIKLLP